MSCRSQWRQKLLDMNLGVTNQTDKKLENSSRVVILVVIVAVVAVVIVILSVVTAFFISICRGRQILQASCS